MESEKRPLPEFRKGMRIEVLTKDNRLIFVGAVQKLKGETLFIEEESGGKLPYVEHNEELKLRGFSGKSFTLAGQICGSSQSVWKVDRMVSLQGSEQRQFFRQSVCIDTELICANAIFDRQRSGPLDRPRPVPCQIVDISVGGLSVRCSERFAEGDWLLIAGVQLLPDKPPFSFTCQVKRAGGSEPTYQYGCALHNMSEQETEQLTRAILMLQRKTLQARRNNNHMV